tara:strand:- start:14461 stop:16254 length:1794 start_codon:yes stop_codon:yes gene_type:complete
MCGIAGYIGKKNINRLNISNTLKLMQNRGPDNQQSLNFKFNDNNVYLLHSRLNIIDLHPRSNQPFSKKNFTIIFNGEIYNYLEIKKKLEKKGYKFKTASDTEVLLTLYMEYQEKCTSYLEGMWAFAIWDNKNKKLFISRDRFGEKPLYIHETDYGFYFGSEIKFISCLKNLPFDINYEKLKTYIQNGYKYLNYDTSTYFKNVSKLEKGTSLSIKKNKIFRHKYFIPNYKIDNSINYEEALDILKTKLFRSVELRLRSDKDIAFCMSGGIDSTALASIARVIFNKKITTFSIIDKDKRYNELTNINFMNKYLEADNQIIKLNKKYDLSELNELIHYHESPVSTISYFIHYLMTKKISENKFSVSFSGVGSDEIFTGYYHHYLAFLKNKKKNLKKEYSDWKKNYWPLIRNPNFKVKVNQIKNSVYSSESDFFIKKKKIHNFKYSNNELRNIMLNELNNQVVPVILEHDDKNSMFNSIENRSPYLDSDLVKFANSIPTNFLIKNGYQKNILREILLGILPDKIRLDRKKVGFNSNIFSVFNKNSIKENYFSLIKNSFLNSIIDFKKININQLINNDKYRDETDKFLYALINVNFFLKKYE